jgi:ABC-2 type transport system ATP-binding protein
VTEKGRCRDEEMTNARGARPVAVERIHSGYEGPTVSIKRLTKEYGDIVALEGVSLEVGRGSLVGLVGPNGAGKSSLVGCLSGIVTPSAGDVRLFGERFHVDSPGLKRRIGVMTAEPALFEELRAYEFLRFVAEIYGLAPPTIAARIEDLFDALGLADAAYRPISSFSSGMRQKLAFAAAVIHRPDLLLLDEPFANVDPQAVAMLRNWLRQFVERRGTVLLTSHGLDNIEQLCSKVVILDKGRILWQGKAESAARKWEVAAGGRSFSSLEDLYLHLVGTPDRKLAWL